MKSHNIAFSLRLTLIMLACALAAGCVQMPTEKQSISDMRPQISFKVNSSDQRITSARVLIDNIDIGAVQEYLDGVSTLKLVSGTHQLRIIQGQQILHEERFYAGDGVTKSFVLK